MVNLQTTVNTLKTEVAELRDKCGDMEDPHKPQPILFFHVAGLADLQF